VGSQGEPVSAEIVARLFAAALPRGPAPPAWLLESAGGRLERARLVYATLRDTKGWTLPKRCRGLKAARELREALSHFIAAGGEVRRARPDGRTDVLRPGGVRRGEAWERFNDLARAMDAAMPHIERHLSGPRKRPPATKAAARAVLDIHAIFVETLNSMHPKQPPPGKSKDGPVVRFVAAALVQLGLPRMTPSAIAKTLQRNR